MKSPGTSYLYNAGGAATKQTLGNSSYVTYDYDDAGSLTSLVNSKSDDSTLSSFTYLLDPAGNRTKMTYSNGDYIEYLYDAVYKLTKESKKDSEDSAIYSQEFYYWGAVGDRTKLVTTGDLGNNTITYSYSYLDQLTSKTLGGTTTTYSYDANGSLTKADDGTNTYTYDYDWDDRLTSYDAPGSSNDTTYGYDSLGWRRVKKSVNGTLTKYLPDVAGTDVLSEYDSSDILQRSYTTPSMDQNVSLYDGTNTYYYMRGGLGSVRGLYNASEALQNSYDYEAFGQAQGVSENVTQPYRFTGRAWDGNSSLHFYRTRYYDHAVGMFTQKDKILTSAIVVFAGTAASSAGAVGSLLPIYGYAGNNPVTLRDPRGTGFGPIGPVPKPDPGPAKPKGPTSPPNTGGWGDCCPSWTEKPGPMPSFGECKVTYTVYFLTSCSPVWTAFCGDISYHCIKTCTVAGPAACLFCLGAALAVCLPLIHGANYYADMICENKMNRCNNPKGCDGITITWP
jgi:RHS repeat-associated protein